MIPEIISVDAGFDAAREGCRITPQHLAAGGQLTPGCRV
jgi:hypothetical protein